LDSPRREVEYGLVVCIGGHEQGSLASVHGLDSAGELPSVVAQSGPCGHDLRVLLVPCAGSEGDDEFGG
jgi:hypothetical protein